MNKILYCPESKYNKNERIKKMFLCISKWIRSKEITDLIKLFGGNEVEEAEKLNDLEYIHWLHRFVKVWDYRKKQANMGERWNVYDEDDVIKNEHKILNAAEALGMININETNIKPDFILPLGGARMTNFDRPNMTKYIIDRYSWTDKQIVALSGNRSLNEIEYPYIRKYAYSAETEYEAMNSGLEKVFSLNNRFTEKKVFDDNPNLCACIRKYDEKYKNSCIYSVAAPSSEPEKRMANSYDTFIYFLKKFDVKKEDRILLVTSSIYVPFQLLLFMDLAIEYGFEVDCIGSDMVVQGNKLSKSSNYLQEIKSTIDVIYKLSNKYYDVVSGGN